MKILFFMISLYSSAKITDSVSLPERKLQQSEDINNVILSAEARLSIDEIKDKVIDMHKNIKLCIENEFDKEPALVLPFNQIVKLCVGENYSILLRFYSEVIFTLKEIIKEKVKNEMTPGFCTDRTSDCLNYFIILGMFMEKEIDVENAFRINEKQILRKMEKPVFDQLFGWTTSQLGDYNTTLALLREERRFLTHFFQEKLEQYNAKFPGN